MSPLGCIILILFLLFVVLVFVGINLIVTRWDRIVVSVMRHCGIYAYPLAIDIALLIERHPEQWNSDTHHLSHPKVGSIWIANEAYGLHVETPFGSWKPNKIERRIIRNAVDWRLTSYLRDRIALAMQKLPDH